MWRPSAAADLEYARSHVMTSRVQVLHGGRLKATLVPSAGEVNAEAKRPVTRNLGATLLDPDGLLTGSDIGDLLSPYDAELMPWRGVILPSGEAEWTPLGVFRLTGKEPPAPGSVTVQGQDRAVIYQGGMASTLAIPGNTPVEAAIFRLLSTRNAKVSMNMWRTGYVCGPLLYEPDTDVWSAALELAESVGGWLAHSRLGDLFFGPSAPSSMTPVKRYTYGDGLLIKSKRTEDFDTIRNVIKVRSGALGLGAVIEAEVSDTNPFSPTYAGGAYGRRIETIVNPHVRSVQQAKQVGAIELERQLGRIETVSGTAVPYPGLDPTDVLLLNDPPEGLIDRTGVLSNVTIPLTADALMSFVCYRSRVAADGHLLETMAQEVTRT